MGSTDCETAISMIFFFVFFVYCIIISQFGGVVTGYSLLTF